MIIIKFKKGKKYDVKGHYYIYERKSFRIDGKVKKKDKYLVSIPEFSWNKGDYFNTYYYNYMLHNGTYTTYPIKFPEELKEDFYKAVERYKAKNSVVDINVQYRQSLPTTKEMA